jgi:bifunctional non-homologous end joining protein LigD
MKSWAVTKGPSLVPGTKRLAVQVEDHPIDYNTFEGTIPKGEYGAGTVLVWDRGRWFPEGDPHQGLKKGDLAFRLEGEKTQGTLAPRSHARQAERTEEKLAADQGARPVGAQRKGPRHTGAIAAFGGKRPVD